MNLNNSTEVYIIYLHSTSIRKVVTKIAEYSSRKLLQYGRKSAMRDRPTNKYNNYANAKTG